MLELTPDRRLTGGIRLLANKAQSTAEPILRGLVPPELVIGLHQHRGTSATPIVEVGQRVAKGEPIAVPGPGASTGVHASSSGRVRAIEERLIPTGARLQNAVCVVIETDGEDLPYREATASTWPSDRAAQLELVRRAGIAGLGGAAFPTAAKLEGVAGRCKALIVNGAECEPYISCDDALMREAPEDIVLGVLRMAELVDAPLAIIVIERDKPRAIQAIGDAARALGDPRLRIAEVPTIYPAGGERQLVELLTGEEVPSGEYPISIGYVCQNVGTAYALQRLASSGEPLTSRIVTVTGLGVARPRNVEVPIGTPRCRATICRSRRQRAASSRPPRTRSGWTSRSGPASAAANARRCARPGCSRRSSSSRRSRATSRISTRSGSTTASSAAAATSSTR